MVLFSPLPRPGASSAGPEVGWRGRLDISFPTTQTVPLARTLGSWTYPNRPGKYSFSAPREGEAGSQSQPLGSEGRDTGAPAKSHTFSGECRNESWSFTLLPTEGVWIQEDSLRHTLLPLSLFWRVSHFTRDNLEPSLFPQPPEFRDCSHVPPSLFYGTLVRLSMARLHLHLTFLFIFCCSFC